MDKIRIVVVDDSAFMRKIIAEMIEKDNRFKVVAKLRNGKELLEKVEGLNPDLITLDLEMPILDGLETLKELKKLKIKYPVVMLSSATQYGSRLTMECLDNGAVDFIPKPSGNISLDIDKVEDVLIEKITDIVNGSLISKKKLISSIHNQKVDGNSGSFKGHTVINAVVIGASTGGPRAVQNVLTSLDGDIGVPIFVVQHMPAGFTKAFAERLDKLCRLKVVEAEDDMNIESNTVYIAQGGYHMEIGEDRRIHLNKEQPIFGVRPAVDKLFESAINLYKSNLLSVILTGMGRDGANGTALIKDNGGITIAEDQSTCTIYGMPKAAYETGKVDLVLPLDLIGKNILNLVKRL